ncbi:MAG: aminotransferase class I/II-fold pyridoxal phosphate-dependent enzyme [Deltaproteobacteria bacterium]|nr:MAG: aminotransferase class I/II-fold pyridoxal phosphate-dependent enzyme [Deltaproteobacteria bacterium]TMQ26954.1 MAG: aminotransferase class I/II-fold pyridoxal phosphate-dependent enzyme [Deltaproteobacteria bacterium]
MTVSPSPRIYLSPPELTGRELALLGEAVASGWIAPLGPQVDAFEAEVAHRLDMPHALALSSGTAALHLALLALGVGPGDTVWTSTLTFAATANAIAYVGATPVFVDSDPASWNLDPGLVADGLDRAARTGALPRALIGVDLYGQCADWEPIARACRRHGVAIIEDAAEALGASYRSRPAGSLGDLAVLSFNGNKIITTSGGGMLLGAARSAIDRARHLATQAREPVRHYEHRDIGYNYRLSNLLAAVGRAQLADLDRRIAARRAIRARYREALGDLPGWSFMPEAGYGRATFWLTTATIDPAVFGASRDEVIDRLAAENIEARPVWKPLHLQPVFAGAPVLRGEIAEGLFRDGICLPSGSGLTPPAQDRVIEIVRKRS